MVLREMIVARRGGFVVGAMLAATLVWTPPASAACHLAAFVDDEASVGESDGTVTVTVELQGRQPSCAGTVDYETRDGSATAGSDYEAQSGALTFVTGDDRVEDIVVTITADDEVEADESFTVVLTGATGVSVGSPDTVTVTITDDDEAQPDPTAEPTTEPDQPTTEPTTPADDPTEAETTQPGPIATQLADDPDEDGTSAAMIALIVVAVIAALGLGGWFVMRGRQT